MLIIDTITRKNNNLSFFKCIKMYVCGSTVYDNTHLGHMRLFLFFDNIVRYFYFFGVDVFWARNITDVDTKIITKMEQRCFFLHDLTDRYTFTMSMDCSNFSVILPTFEPAATRFVQYMLQLIDVLLNIGAAYISCGGDVYYNVSTNNLYGKLSSQKLTDLHFGVRVIIESSKRSSTDFVLWKRIKKKNSVVWNSKWGQGRPGWHIECSAMFIYYFGENVTIHGGGVDLTFPHHENECAQTESVFKQNCVDVWLHVGLVFVKQQKMSKTFRNFIKVKNLLRVFDSDTIRCFLLRSHYKLPVDYNINKLQLCSIFLDKVTQLLNFFKINTELYVVRFTKVYETTFFTDFIHSTSLDFNTPLLLKQVQDFLDIIWKCKRSSLHKECLFLVECLILVVTSVGLFLNYAYTLKVSFYGITMYKTMFMLFNARKVMRFQKQWLLADALRDVLYNSGFVVEDGRD